MKRSSVLFLCLFVCSCGSVGKTLKYGYLPGGEYKYYAPIDPVDLKGKHYRLNILDRRDTNTIKCAEFLVPRDTELEGAAGYVFFSNYLRAMIEANNGVIDSNGDRFIDVELKVLSGELKVFVYGYVWGLVEFAANTGEFRKTYCSAMADSDKDAPVGKYAMETRKGVFRKLVAASTRRALEEFMHDLASKEK